MNRAYKLVWNATQQAWTVASELARGHKKSGTIRMAAVVLGGLLTAQVHAVGGAAMVLPSGESVAYGNATFDRSTALLLKVNQTSNKLITNWNSFDVGSAATVQFVQPNANSVVLNRVTSASPTSIAGKVSANGQLMIVNPNGIVFGAGSQVSASSITASTLQITNNSLASGNYVFTRGTATGSVENNGTLTATAGNVFLLAPTIKNGGSIVATGGNVSLVNADQVNTTSTMITQPSSIAGLIKNTGSIQATHISSSGLTGLVVLVGDTTQAGSKVELGGTLNGDFANVAEAKNIEVTNTLNTGSLTLQADDNITIGADINVVADGGLVLEHGTDAGEGYFLDHAAKVNLSGSNAFFKVNDESYTVVQTVAQLQNMYTGLNGKYVLATDLNGNGADFEPIAPYNDAMGEIGPFTGTFDGLGHVIANLRLVQSGYNDMGLFGATQNATLRNIGIEGFELAARNNIGGLVGYMDGGSISNSYVRNSTITLSSVNGPYSFGGLVGVNNYGTINNSYADVAITAPVGNGWNIGSTVSLGGLVGNNNHGSINNSYSTSTVRSYDNDANSFLGGLAGINTGTINNSYAAGLIDDQTGLATTVRGGLTAMNTTGYWWDTTVGVANNSYWNIDTTATPASVGGTGLTTTQMQHASSFNGWSIDAEGGTGSVWRIYEGSSAPLLRSFLKQTWATTTNSSKTYDGSTDIVSSHTQSDPSVIFQGSAVYVTDSSNAGNQTINIRGLYSDQQGYDLIVNKGIAAIAKRDVTITSTDASKVYDGTTSAKSNAVFVGGSFADDQYITSAVFNYADKNAGSGKSLTLSSYSINDGNNGGNYNVTYVANTNSSIAKRQLVISAVADSKEYDGKLTASVTAKPVVTGRQRGDAIVGLTQSYLDKNAGTGKAINVDAGYTIRDGNNGNNYDVVIVNSNAGVITPKALTISTVANSKVYDGGVTSANKPSVTGLVSGDRITGLYQQYDTKTVGTGKKLIVKSGYVVSDGNGGNNYSVTEQGSMDGVITAN